MKIKLFFSIIILTVISINANSQDYVNAIGFRGGLSNGVSFKHFISTTDAAEGILATRWDGFNITGLLERHSDSFNVDRLYFYYGAGAHIGLWDGDVNPWFNDGATHTVLGIDGIIGVEYVLQEIPFNISLDWKPGYNLIGYSGFWGDELALSFRFIF